MSSILMTTPSMPKSRDGTDFGDVLDRSHCFFYGCDAAGPIVGFAAPSFEGLESFVLRVGYVSVFRIADGVEEHVEGAFGGLGGVELAEGAGCGVTWIDVDGEAGGFALFVEAVERGDGVEDFASEFDGAWNIVAVEGEGYRVDGSDVVGNVLALGAVAACGCLYQYAVDVCDGDCEPVDFEFEGEVSGVDFEIVEGTLVPGVEGFFAGYVAEAEHWNRVLDRFELLRWGCADAEGW